jgi:hypothetical protein
MNDSRIYQGKCRFILSRRLNSIQSGIRFFYFITGKKEAKEMQEEHKVWRAGIPDTFYPVKKLQNYIEYGTCPS